MASTMTYSLQETLTAHVREGVLYEKLPDAWVRCHACGHNCRIGPEREGICKVRYNQGGVLYVPHGYTAGMHIDPIEKKPFFHVLPGAATLSFGMLGCDYHCAYCQNWFTSQAIRDPAATADHQPVSAEDIVSIAVNHGTPVITSTYNEPLITSEWAVEVFRLARQRGIRCAYVSNGNGTPQVLDYLRPYIDFYKVDLKSFQQKNYQKLGGRLDRVLETIRGLKERGVWVEVVTLVVPGFNDSDEELRSIALFLAGVSRDIPWHVTAFHQDYRMTEPDNTPAQTLIRAADIGQEAGLHFVYAGNLPGRFENLEHTRCPSCKTSLIERNGFAVSGNRMVSGACPSCRTAIPGVWA
jgi:pyruvate formate lyase activating enzyme